MAPFVVNQDAVRAFKDRGALERWYASHHGTAPELWLKLHKKDSGLPSVSNAEALDVALCWGWIDAIRKSFDDKSFLQRYVPRGRKSIWSQRNQQIVARLIAEDRMTEFGHAEIERAKADGRWDRAYGGSKDMPIPDDLLAAVEAEPAAMEMLQSLNAQNRFALAFRLHNMKTQAGRNKKVAAFVEMLKRGETIYPNGKGRPR